jgi:hypothetical protein
MYADLVFDSDYFASVIGAAFSADPVGKTVSSALGAGDKVGGRELKVGSAPLVSSCLRDFSFRDSHDEPPLSDAQSEKRTAAELLIIKQGF